MLRDQIRGGQIWRFGSEEYARYAEALHMYMPIAA